MTELEQLNERLDRLEKSVGELLGEMNAQQILAERRARKNQAQKKWRKAKAAAKAVVESTLDVESTNQNKEKNEEAEKRDIPPKPPIESKGEEVRKEEKQTNACAREEGVVQTKKPKKKKAPARFKKPTVEEVAAYCKERDNGIDPEYFWNYYDLRGWKPAGYRTQMTDWKKAIITWEKNRKKNPRFNPRGASRRQPFKTEKEIAAEENARRLHESALRMDRKLKELGIDYANV